MGKSYSQNGGSVFKIFTGKPTGMRLLGRPRRREKKLSSQENCQLDMDCEYGKRKNKNGMF